MIIFIFKSLNDKKEGSYREGRRFGERFDLIFRSYGYYMMFVFVVCVLEDNVFLYV